MKRSRIEYEFSEEDCVAIELMSDEKEQEMIRDQTIKIEKEDDEESHSEEYSNNLHENFYLITLY